MRPQTLNDSQNCYLLDLYGGKLDAVLYTAHTNLTLELRNRIYDFASEDKSVAYFPRRIRDGNYTEEQLRAYGVMNIPPQSLGLAQTCRQIRAQYMPVYARTATIHACHLDIPEFLRKGFPHMGRDSDGKVLETSSSTSD